MDELHPAVTAEPYVTCSIQPNGANLDLAVWPIAREIGHVVLFRDPTGDPQVIPPDKLRGQRMVRLTTMVSALLLTFFGTTACVSETVDVNGVELHYTIHGDGPPLLLLHGYGGTGDRTWKHLLPKFKPHFQLIVPDLRGHGRSSFTKDNFTHRQAAKDVLALLDHLEISSTSAIGNSTGAMTLLHVATIAPKRVKSMVLNSATTHFPKSAQEIMETVKDDGESALGDYFADERMAVMHKLGPKQHEWLRRSFREVGDTALPFMLAIDSAALSL